MKNTYPRRIWELDALCGIVILLMIAYHLYHFVNEFCISKYQIDHYRWVNLTDPLHCWFDWGDDGRIYMAMLTPDFIQRWMMIGQDTFFLLSGISCVLSRNTTRLTIRLLVAGYAFTAFTFLLAKAVDNPAKFMKFGPLLCYAYCHLFFILLLEKRNNKTILIVALSALILGYVQRYVYPIYIDSLLLFPFGYHSETLLTGEYMPIFPMLGWMLLGVLLGRKFYSEKKSLFPNSILNRHTKWLQWFGKNSGSIYVGHLILFNVVFYGIGYAFNLF